MRVFLDSSAIAKRYVEESGSEAVIAWCDRATELGIASIALPEIVSAFCRLRREKKLGESQYRQLKKYLFSDIEDIQICELSPQVLALAIKSLEENPLRAMDAIHVGCAIAWRAEMFISADKRQCAAARKAALKVTML